MFIDDPVKAFGITPCQAKAFATRLRDAARKREASFEFDPHQGGPGHYNMGWAEATNGDRDVELALRLSWNECMAFIKSQGIDL